jgi:hypothetical protein
VLLEDMYCLPGTYTGTFEVDQNYVKEKLG